jgi:hypothetical protein
VRDAPAFQALHVHPATGGRKRALRGDLQKRLLGRARAGQERVTGKGSVLRIALSILAAVGALACGNGAEPPGWTGIWSCSFVITGLAADSFTEFIDIAAGPNGSITITPIVDSGIPCYLAATTSGSTGTFASNQPCAVPGGTYGGTLTLMGDSLTFSASWTDPYGGGTEQATCMRR